MLEQRLMSRIQFATFAGVTRGAITRALDGVLGDALVGQQIDVNHSIAVAYVDKHRALNAARHERDRKSAGDTENKSKVDQYLDMSLREIVEFFGSDIEFINWLKSSKILEDVKEKRIKNEITLGGLIPRDFVKTYVLALVETICVRLLNDSPRTITARVIESHDAAEPREAIEKMVCDLISIQLKNIKERVCRVLKK